jgi:integrase
MKAVARRREAVLLDIELNRFDYSKHFPSGRNAHIFDQGSTSPVLFVDAANEWLKRHQTRIQYSTLRGYSSVIRCHLIPQFGGFSLTDINAKIIRDWMTTLDVSHKRINNILIPLRMILEEAYQDEIIGSNPTHRIKNLPLLTREPEPFSKKDIDEILQKMSGLGRNLIEFAFHSGLRTSELIALQWKNVDITNNRIYVREAIVSNKTKQPKTASGNRTVFLNERSRNALVRHKKLSTTANGLVFYDDRNPGKALNDQKIRKRYWTPALISAGIKYRPPYQTRHTFASQMLQSGKKPAWVAAQLGHSNAAITFARYARWIPNNEN